ncbi:MAG: shikimate kinase [Desulfovibrio sp.]|nr:shikimate kinase [Desulfovibrio sp.]
MAGAGKSTVGKSLAAELGWAFIDTDNLLEALYACGLQKLADAAGKKEFIDIEATMIGALKASRTVIATGGSVVYSDEAVAGLAELGPIVYLKTELATILERIALNPERGLALDPGETAADLYREREALYEKAANLVCDTSGRSPAECARYIRDKLENILKRRDD